MSSVWPHVKGSSESNTPTGCTAWVCAYCASPSRAAICVIPVELSECCCCDEEEADAGASGDASMTLPARPLLSPCSSPSVSASSSASSSWSCCTLSSDSSCSASSSFSRDSSGATRVNCRSTRNDCQRARYKRHADACCYCRRRYRQCVRAIAVRTCRCPPAFPSTTRAGACPSFTASSAVAGRARRTVFDDSTLHTEYVVSSVVRTSASSPLPFR